MILKLFLIFSKKNVPKNLIALLPYLLIIFSCKIHYASTNRGVVLNIAREYHPDSKQLYSIEIFPDLKIWFKDSLAIEEIKRVHQTQFDDNVTVIDSIHHYSFIDLRTKAVYEYTSFSDTATLIRKYVHADSIPFERWGFWIPTDLKIEVKCALPDTLINKVYYKRLKLVLKQNNQDIQYVGFLRCDKKGTMFDLVNGFSDKVGCPLVRLDVILSSYPPYPLSNEIKFVSDTLSQEELKVFAAWEKNAKENPVK